MKNLNIINITIIALLDLIALLVISLSVITNAGYMLLDIGVICLVLIALSFFKSRIKHNYVFISKAFTVSLLILFLVYLTLPFMALTGSLSYLIVVSCVVLNIGIVGIGFKAAITKTMPIV